MNLSTARLVWNNMCQHGKTRTGKTCLTLSNIINKTVIHIQCRVTTFKEDHGSHIFELFLSFHSVIFALSHLPQNGYFTRHFETECEREKRHKLENDEITVDGVREIRRG